MSDDSIFIAHGPADEAWARRLEEALAERAVRAFRDRAVITRDGDWVSEIDATLGRSRFAAIVVPLSGELAPDVLTEMGAALSMGKEMVPIVARETPREALFGPLRKRRPWIERGEPREVAARLVQRLAAMDAAA